MLEIALYSILIIAGSVIYSILDDKPKESIPTKDNSVKNKEQEIYDNTYNYFMSLTLEEQHKYINDNLDLRYYKDELLYDNKQSTARQVARRAVKYNKEFTNRYKVY